MCQVQSCPSLILHRVLEELLAISWWVSHNASTLRQQNQCWAQLFIIQKNLVIMPTHQKHEIMDLHYSWSIEADVMPPLVN